MTTDDAEVLWHTAEFEDFARLEEKLTPPVLVAFCRAFVGADRISALHSLLLLLTTNVDSRTVRYERDLMSVILLIYGTMYETCRAVFRLWCLQVGDRVVGEDGKAAWARIVDLAPRWLDGIPKTLRNKAGFHFDAIKVTRGMVILKVDGKPVKLFEADVGDAPTMQLSMRLNLGMETLLRGLNIDNKVLMEFLPVALKDHGQLPNDLQYVFVDLMNTAGIKPKFRRAPPDEALWDGEKWVSKVANAASQKLTASDSPATVPHPREVPMPLLPCPTCGREVSSQAETCPQCGHPLNAEAIQVRAERGADLLVRAGLMVLLVVLVSGISFACGAMYTVMHEPPPVSRR